MKLGDKVAIVTGAGSGMGQAASLLFAREGARVVVCDVDDDGGNETVRKVKEAGGEAAYFHCDVSKSAEVQEMVTFSIRTYSKLDVLFSNAGITGRGSLLDITEEFWDRVQAVNLKGTFLCCKYAIPELIKQPTSSIVITSSGAALVGKVPGDYPVPALDAYAAAKGGLLSLTRSIAAHFGKHGLRANVICPGTIQTPMTAGLHAIPEFHQAILKWIPLGRVGLPEEIATVALFLASDDASYVSGVVLPVDGGAIAAG